MSQMHSGLYENDKSLGQVVTKQTLHSFIHVLRNDQRFLFHQSRQINLNLGINAILDLLHSISEARLHCKQKHVSVLDLYLFIVVARHNILIFEMSSQIKQSSVTVCLSYQGNLSP